MNIIYKEITDLENLQKLISIFDIVFEKKSTPDINALKSIILNKSILNLGAFVDDNLVGGLSAHELALISGNKEFYIYDIGVLPKYQKMGIGTGLIKELKNEANERGISTIFVEAEADDDGAVVFYRSLGEEEIAVRHFNIRV